MSLLRIQIIKDLITVEAKNKKTEQKRCQPMLIHIQLTILQLINYVREKRPMTWLNG